MPSFHVRGKMFLHFVDDHHGDGRIAAWCKSTHTEQKRLVAEDPERFFVPPYVGVAGWVGVRLDHPRVDWIELAILAETAWQSIAPKRIAETATKARKAPPLRLPKTDRAKASAALDRLTRMCATLPETDCERSGSHATYRVGKKVFAYFLDNHHGDEIIGACVKAPQGENKKLAQKDPKRFYLPSYIGPKGWIGIRLDAPRVDWDAVADRVTASYALVAPKRLTTSTRPR
jgi:hypothetical protein